MLTLCEIIEEKRNNIKNGTAGGNKNEHTKKRNENAVYIIKCVRRIKNILAVCSLLCKHLTDGFVCTGKDTGHKISIIYNSSCVFNVHSESFLKCRNNAGGNESDNGADCCNRGKHTVNSFTCFILLIIADIRLNGGIEDVRKRADNTVAIQADENHPNRSGCDFARKNNHCKNENDIQKVCNDLNILFTVLTNEERCHDHTPKSRVTVKSYYKTVHITRACAAVVIEPCKDIGVSGFKEADPACKRNNPEILILCNGLKSVRKFNLNNMGFCLNYFFLRICINNYKQCGTEHAQNREHESVNADIRLICVENIFRNKRHNKVYNRGSE